MPAGAGSGLNGTLPRQAEVMHSPDRSSSHPLRSVLERVSPTSCPTEFNFHCHTTCSDGSLSPEQLGHQAVQLGLQHLAVTDHHSTRAYRPLQEWLDHQRLRGVQAPHLWSGMEISCLLEGCLVHVLALGFELDHHALAPYSEGQSAIGEALKAEEVRRRIHDAGGLALLAHPGRYRLPFQRLIQAAAEQGFDGAEAYYDYEMQASWRPTPVVCEAVAALLEKHALLRSCGTDTHGLELCGR
jgi:predicted metal-dependent phosphoesterase TrpH